MRNEVVDLNIRNAQTKAAMSNFIHSTFRSNLFQNDSIMIENARLEECADYSGISLKVLDNCAEKMAKRYNRTNEAETRDFIANGYKVTLHIG